MTSVATFTNSSSTANVATSSPVKPPPNVTTAEPGPVTSSGSTVAGEENESNCAEATQVTGRQSLSKEGRLRLRKWSNAVSRRMSISSNRAAMPRVAPSPEPTNQSSSRLSLTDRSKPASPFSPRPQPFSSLLLCCGAFFPFLKPNRTRTYQRAPVRAAEADITAPVPDTANEGASVTPGSASTPSIELESSSPRHVLPPISSPDPLPQDMITSVSVDDDLPAKALPASPTSEPSPAAPAAAVSASDIEEALIHHAPANPDSNHVTDDDDVSSDEEAALRSNPQLSEIVAATSKPAPSLLPPLLPSDQGKKCLVLDLDETLLHSSFRVVDNPDYIVPVKLEGQTHNVYVLKRPGVDEFMRQVGEAFEVVVFTASLSKYADPVLDLLDMHKVVRHRLFRESCILYGGNYVKDLSRMGRPLTDLIIVDNSPASYAFHPNNAIPITTWFNDTHDTELLDLVPFLMDLKDVLDVSSVLDNTNVI
ncbi:hypothetical protein IWQ60_002443 [Tieghemiomyces parasiticus]|uniref:protein-serine/threonine phosphatase n=1 Tax=Tieghemiomyces parasiticus TaxID=78921 RepID=A0A9W8DXE5_9FUNG|nr:hypothetical protein IWQ60_002443 [Tieghemiomyces parasiticus]